MADSAMQGLFWATLIGALLRASTPILLAANGGLVTEACGATNVALEGLLLISAFFGVIGSAYAAIWMPGMGAGFYACLGLCCGLAAALIFSLVLAFLHLELGADLVIAGIGINMLAAGLTIYLMSVLTGDKGSTASLASYALPVLHIPGFATWPIVDVLLNSESRQGHHVLVYASLISCLGVHGLLARTSLGLRLRAIGESREAAIAAGIDVKKSQYLAFAISGLCAGLGGLHLSMGYLAVFQADMSAGRGFLALAAVFLGTRRPLGTVAASFLFGASTVLAAQLGLLAIPSQLVYMIPPFATLAAMAAAGAWRRARSRRTQAIGA